MKILAILQNQWFKNPEQAQAIYDRHPNQRNNLIAKFLFMGSLTGRRLQQAFGVLCEHIIWEEASPKVAGFSASKFPADPKHLVSAIERHRPDLILCFGKIATDGIKSLNLSLPLLCGPHPAARQNPMPALKEMARTVKAFYRKGEYMPERSLIEQQIINQSIKLAQQEAARTGLKFGDTVAHPDLLITCKLLEIHGDQAIIGWGNVRREFPLSELFDPNVAIRETKREALGIRDDRVVKELARWKADLEEGAKALVSEAQEIARRRGWNWKDPDVQMKCCLSVEEGSQNL